MCLSKLLAFFKKKEDDEEIEDDEINNEPINEEVEEPVDDTNDEPVDEPIDDTNDEQIAEDSEEINLGQGEQQNIVILIDNGHGYDTKGKRSPYSCYGIKPEIDFFEYLWNRQIAKPIVEQLKGYGYNAQLLVPEENDISLGERVRRVNKICSQVGTKNVILISVHANAAGNGREWKSAQGWCAFTSKGNTKSDTIAEYLYTEAEKNFKGRKIRKDMSDGDKDWEENFAMTYKTYCPAVLTENFFYDNVDDVKYILSDEGRYAVIKTHVDGIINYIKSLSK